MTAPQPLRRRATHSQRVRRLITAGLRLVLGGLLLIPLSRLVRKTNSVVFIPRFPNSFDGNLKYLFLHVAANRPAELDCQFVTGDRAVEAELRAAGLPVLRYPGPGAAWRLLRARAVVVDGNEWVTKFRYQLLHAAKKYQLWHGSGMKTVGMLKPRVTAEPLPRRIVSRLLGLHPRYELLWLSSELQRQTRGSAFNYRRCLIDAQPRNDVLFAPGAPEFEVGIDPACRRRIAEARAAGMRVVLYAPTHRKPTETFRRLMETLDPAALEAFARRHNLLVVFKYHPKTRPEHHHDLTGAAHLTEYRKDRDIYPALGEVDLMITDYSSIFVDYLLLDRPVVFFPFDYDHYVNSERPLQFEYHHFTPGPKCHTGAELLEELERVLIRGDDRHAPARRETLARFYDVTTPGACRRVWEAIEGSW